jgi:transketolase
VTLDDIKTFRQAGTGPLGQGAATSVSMAIARQWLSATYNRLGFDLFDFDVYPLCGDGDMMEGIASEAASLAGQLLLANLCRIYDSNRESIEGEADIVFTEGVAARVVSMPSRELFEEQEAGYRDSVMPPAATARVTVEEGSTLGWQRFAGSVGVVLGMHTFGMSAPVKVVAEHLASPRAVSSLPPDRRWRRGQA